MKPSFTYLAAIAAALIGVSIAKAEGGTHFINPTQEDIVTHDIWTNLAAGGENVPSGGSFPGTTMWTPIASQSGSTGSAVLAKIANGSGGGPFPSGASIYFGGFSGDANTLGGTLAVQSAAIADLASVTFQLDIGEAFGYDFYDHTLPTLTYTTGAGTFDLDASVSLVLDKTLTGTVQMPTGPGGTMQDEPIYQNTYLLQWDFTGISDVQSLDIEFTGAQHAQLYGLQLDQGTTFSAVAVPEPATYAAIFGGLALIGALLVRRHRSGGKDE